MSFPLVGTAGEETHLEFGLGSPSTLSAKPSPSNVCSAHLRRPGGLQLLPVQSLPSPELRARKPSSCESRHGTISCSHHTLLVGKIFFPQSGTRSLMSVPQIL